MIVGTGIDVIEIARVERAMHHSGERFARRVFAPGEIAACRACRLSGPQFAVRFAVKEAVMKALGTGWGRGVRWVDIETVVQIPGSTRRLGLRLHGRAAELAAERGARPHLSVSRTRSHALALVLLESPGS